VLPCACTQVYRAICKPYNEEVAVKLLDLENMNCSLDEIVREAQVGAAAVPPRRWLHGGRSSGQRPTVDWLPA
jgi:hypothetical protein